MRYIQLKTTVNPLDAKDVYIYRDLLSAIVRKRGNKQEDSLDWDEMNRLQSLVKKLSDLKPEDEWLVLENAEWEQAVRKVKKFDWPFYADPVFNFVSDIINAPETDPRLPAEPEEAKAAEA